MDRCVVRQAIKDVKEERIVGYELLFQGGKDSLYNNNETSAADTISNFLLSNSAKIINDKPMFVTFTPSLLLRNTPKMFGQEKIIIQIEDTVIIHPLAMPIIRKYCDNGYQFAINDFQFSPKYFSMLDYAAYIRISMAEYAPGSPKQKTAVNIIQMARGFGKKCIATNVDTKEAYDSAVELGVDYLEGSYVANTLVSKVDKVEYMQGNFFQLMVAVSKDEPDFMEVEEIISRDAGLTYQLLKLVNSAYFALRTRTASIRQALVTLGIGQLRHWVYMLSFDQEEHPGSEELLKISFLRAKLASEIAGMIPGRKFAAADAYMMGMFSTLDYMVNAPLKELLDEIPVPDEVKVGLLTGEGIPGKVQKLVIAYEHADWKSSKELAEELGIPSKQLAQIYVDCVEEVNNTWNNLMTDVEA
ncbi:MAG: HDOD domain-containing protein [Ruminococcus sp.]|nr:HDOD domain-containing protein [Ruminococcus sp.]